MTSDWGVVGQPAPAWSVAQWVDADGQPRAPLELADLAGRWKIVFCFQSWCRGCHSHGAPAMRELVRALSGNERVALAAVQTVFEGFEANTFEAMKKFQADHELTIPFGHDPGDEASGNRSNIMWHYQSGGTPWFIVIDPAGQVVFNDFRIDAARVVAMVLSTPAI